MTAAMGTKTRLIVVGGGTAGWLSAMILQAEAKRRNLPLEITLIESSKIPTIGVGEGTTSIFGGVLQALGLNEAEFLAKTDATIKYGIRHLDWRRLGHSYDGPIDDAYALADRIPNAGPWIDTFCVAAGRSVTEPHLYQALMKMGKAPVAEQNGRIIPLSQFHHAYHFDQAKVGAFLREKSDGITHVDAVVSHVNKHSETGDITSLDLDNGTTIAADFFVDCTGFSRRLISKEMGVNWQSYGDVLPVNRAMPFWIDLPDDQEIPAYTLAWAQSSGWMWQIPTQERIGCGYVYSDRHISPDQAIAEIEQTLGFQIEPRADIKIDAGRLDKVWSGNVLALGLSSSFLEPLEATSIHGTIVSVLLFANRHLATLGQADAAARETYNSAIAQQVDDFRDFINLHYVSERDDSSFWQDVSHHFIRKETRAKLAHWRNHMPSSADFSNDLDGLPHVEELLHYPVLDGLGLLNRDIAKTNMARDPKLRAFARDTVDHLGKQAKELAGRALSHRSWLASLKS